jgi:hypothetical protein
VDNTMKVTVHNTLKVTVHTQDCEPPSLGCILLKQLADTAYYVEIDFFERVWSQGLGGGERYESLFFSKAGASDISLEVRCTPCDGHSWSFIGEIYKKTWCGLLLRRDVLVGITPKDLAWKSGDPILKMYDY